jgi:hypothetical protein
MGVEIDPHNGFTPIGEPKVLIAHNSDRYGWEAQWREDGTSRDGWNEGATMFKHNGKYYLQYAAPGTELRGYADGVYIGNSPLGDFTPQASNPFCIKPGGFIGGAGHGHTFLDKFGNLWHVATMKISVRHMFERRIGLFPAYFTENGELHAHTVWTDYPFRIPQEKVDFAKDDLSMGWNLLSYNKKVIASSFLENYKPEKANDEQIETWWNAKTGKSGEWWVIDLGEEKIINAILISFADADFNADNSFLYQYDITTYLENGEPQEFFNKTSDKPHELIVFDKEIKARKIRIYNKKKMLAGHFSLSGVRVFGENKKESHWQNFSAIRDKNDPRIYRFSWQKQKNATGYILRWGIKPNELHNAVMIYGTEYEGRFFNRDTEYYFELTAF